MEKISAIYSPSTGRIACVLLQADYGCDNREAMLFDTKDWILAPEDGLARITDTLENWRAVAAMSLPQRVALIEKAKQSPLG